MSTASFTGLLAISAIAVAAPILAASVKRVKPPGAVAEIAAGIIAGPPVLAGVKIDQPVTVAALLGLAFLLFLAGLEIDLRAMTPRRLRAPLAGLAGSLLPGAVAGTTAGPIPKRSASPPSSLRRLPALPPQVPSPAPIAPRAPCTSRAGERHRSRSVAILRKGPHIEPPDCVVS